MTLGREDVQDILHILDSTAYDELEIETASFRLALRRSPDGSWTQETQALSLPQRSESADREVENAVSVREVAAADESSGTPAAAVTAKEAPRGGTGVAHDGLHEVHPPMPGTFYRAPKPGAAPFVEVGSRVQPDSVVCIVETMKLMNSVCAGVAGEVVEICLDDGQFAEAVEVLLRVRPEVGACS